MRILHYSSSANANIFDIIGQAPNLTFRFSNLHVYKYLANPLMYNKKAVKSYEEGLAFQRGGRPADAERAYKKAIKINQDFIEAHNDLGNVLLDRGRYKEAFNSFRKALTLRPGHPMLLTNLGNAMQLQGEIVKAIDWFNKAIAQDPNFIGAHNNLGNALRDLGRFQEAVAAYKQTISINPDYADSYYNLASVLIQLDGLEEAVSNFEKAIDIDPGHQGAYNGLGNALAFRGEMDRAVSAYRKAIEINPNHKHAHNGLGNVLSDMGDLDEAIGSYRRAIEINPDNADVYRTMSSNKKFTEYDDDIQTMESFYTSKGISDAQKMHLSFALGKAYEDLGEYEKSMDFILQANRLKRSTLDYSTSESVDLFNNIKATFSSEFFDDRKGMGNPDETPIFVLGMPRSGTSLVEQILASHPDVFGAGELTDLPVLTRKIFTGRTTWEFPEGISELDSAALQAFGEKYIAAIRRHSGEAKHVTDKLPPNFVRIGLIRTILPNARIINCTREPMDNCLSLFKNYFSSPINYSYDLTELGQYYNLYLDLMTYWRETLPGFVYDLNYEQLIADQENQIRQLLDYCHLPWDDACLAFHKTRRKVRTASNAQVRRPIYKDSVELWKRYEKQLEPLRAAIYA
jgi:tetratricopeptide (TPR) repeat protein